MPAILRPPPAAFSRALALAAALALAGCAGSWEAALEETRAGLIGKTGRQLRECLGVPSDFDQRGDVELLTFRFAFAERRELVPPVTDPRTGIRFPEPRLSEPGFCQLDFELDAKGVTKVTAHGVDDHGLRSDGQCMLRAQPCVDGDYVRE
jgi:hypothetical protein